MLYNYWLHSVEIYQLFWVFLFVLEEALKALQTSYSSDLDNYSCDINITNSIIIIFVDRKFHISAVF